MTERAYAAAAALMGDTRENADRAVIARRKAGERRHIAAIAGTTEWAPLYPKPDPNDGRLPESAFDWPIYRAALERPSLRGYMAHYHADTGDLPWPGDYDAMTGDCHG